MFQRRQVLLTITAALIGTRFAVAETAGEAKEWILTIDGKAANGRTFRFTRDDLLKLGAKRILDTRNLARRKSMVQAHARPISRFGMALGTKRGKEAAEQRQHPRLPAGADNSGNLVSKGDLVDLPLVRTITGGRHSSGFDDWDAVLEQIGGGFEHQRPRQANQRRIEAAKFARMGGHGDAEQGLRKWQDEALRPTHDPSRRQILTRSDRLGTSLADPSEADDREPPLHRGVPHMGPVCIARGRCSLTQVNGSIHSVLDSPYRMARRNRV